MKLFAKLLALSCLMGSSLAFADLQIKCANRKKTVSWEYSIKGTPSARLASDILYTNNGTPKIIFASSVAQYVATNQLLGIMIDDASENIVYRFLAPNPTSRPFAGKLEIANQRTTIDLICSTTTI